MDVIRNAAATSIVIPAFNEAAAIGSLVSELRAAASWHEVIVVDDGSSDDTSACAADAGATVIRHPYNKGNGASRIAVSSNRNTTHHSPLTTHLLTALNRFNVICACP